MLFISHASADDDFVTKLDARFTESGIDTWFDHKSIKSSDDWDAKIQEALNACDMALLVLSNASAKSDPVRNERQYILDLGITLFVAKIEDIKMKHFPWRLKLTQYVDLREDNYEAGLAELIEAITGQRPLDLTKDYVHEIPKFTTDQGRAIDPRLRTIDLYGRDADLKEVQTSLDAGQPTFITGIGGIGKSRLAYEVADKAEDIAGVIWHQCSEFSSRDSVVELLKKHFGLQPDTSEDETLAQLERAPQKPLVVIDNAESVTVENRQEGFIDLVNLLNQAGAPVLLTSREMWQDDRLVARPPHHLQQLSPEAAIEVCRSLCKFHDLPLTDEQLEELSTKARLHPGLIEWSMPRLRDLGFEDVIKALESLAGLNIEEAIEKLILLNVAEMVTRNGPMTEATLKCLNVFRGDFTIEAAREMAIDPNSDTLPQNTNDLNNVLRVLIRWQFLRRDQDKQRYQIDQLVIDAVGENQVLHDQHYQFYLALAKKHREKQDYLGLDPESENLYSAFERQFAAGDFVAAFQLCNACFHFLENRGRHKIHLGWLLRLGPKIESSDIDALKADFAILLGLAYQQLSEHEQPVENLGKAIVTYERALEHYTPASAPLDYAMTQNNLGISYCSLAAHENPQENLRLAIAAYQRALEHYTPASAPLDYAMTQNNLGNTYEQLSKYEQPVENLGKALAAYERALEHYTPASAPLNYATTQNNLGNTYQQLSNHEQPVENLGKALAAYERALEHYSPASAPLDYAMTQNNLGCAYDELSQHEDPQDNLGKAIVAYERALEHYSPASAPLDYAMTQYNLGCAYDELSQHEDPQDNLGKAIVAYERALEYRTSASAPLFYAMTQNNLGCAYDELSRHEDPQDNLGKAIVAYERALEYRTSASAPLDYGRTQYNLGCAYDELSQHEDPVENLRLAMAAYERALEHYSPASAPLSYANTQANLGISFEELAEHQDQEPNLEQAITCWEKAKIVYEQAGASNDAEEMQSWIDIAKKQL